MLQLILFLFFAPAFGHDLGGTLMLQLVILFLSFAPAFGLISN